MLILCLVVSLMRGTDGGAGVSKKKTQDFVLLFPLILFLFLCLRDVFKSLVSVLYSLSKLKVLKM